MDPITELLAEMKATATRVERMSSPAHYQWATVATAYPNPYTVRFDTQTSTHPVIAPEPCRPGDRVLCLRMGTQTIIDQVIQRPWRTVTTFYNGWTNGEGHRPLMYRRLGDVVYFRGVINSGTQGYRICYIDQDCWPTGSVTATMTGSWGNEARQIRIDPSDGSLRHQVSVTYSSSWTALDGASFSVV